MCRLDYERILTILFIASVFLLAVCKIWGTDAWVHLSAGRLIWETKGLPYKEPFVYTLTDKPFHYSNWLFGLVYYISYRLFDSYGVILLKAFTVTAAFYILLRDSLRPYKNQILTIVMMTAVLLAVRPRFIDRPDIFLMLYLSFSIFCLNASVYEGKKYIYALPIIHMLWANMHSSINLMFVPFFSFIAGGLLQQYLSRFGITFSNTPSKTQLKTIMVIFSLSFAASAISPYFISQYTFSADYLASDWYKQEIPELRSPAWNTDRWPYVITAAVLLSFVLNWFVIYRSRFTNAEREYPSLIHFLLIIPFIMLAFTAIRFIFLLAIVAGPVLIRNSSAISNKRQWNRFFLKKALAVSAVIWIITYTILALIRTEPFGSDEYRFGFGINYDSTPELALRYMDKKGISGKVFNSFNIGSYITWRDFPRRMAFIDSRGSVIPDLLEKRALALAKPSVLDELYRLYGFESVLIEYPLGDVETTYTEIDLGLKNPQWALVYWDNKSLLYLKRGGDYDSVIMEDEYRFVKPANGINYLLAKLDDKDYHDGAIKEILRNVRETDSAKAHIFMGFIYNKTSRYRDAVREFFAISDKAAPSDRALSYNGMAYAYLNLGNLDEAIKYCRKFLFMQEDAIVSYNLGTAYLKKGDKKAAFKYFRNAIEMNVNLTYIYPQLIDISRELGRKNDFERFSRMYEEAKAAKVGEEHFKNGINAYSQGKYDIAIDEFNKAIEIIPSSSVAYSNLGYVYFDMDQVDKAFEYQKKAIDLDPDLASAHYGLAQIYKKRGDAIMAKRHFVEYLRIEPSGYFSRRAKEEIRDIK